MSEEDLIALSCTCGTPKFQGKSWCYACRIILPLVDCLEKTKIWEDPEYRVSPEIRFVLNYIYKQICHSLKLLGYTDF